LLSVAEKEVCFLSLLKKRNCHLSSGMRRRKSFSSRCRKWLSVVLVVALLLADGIKAANLDCRPNSRRSVAAGGGEMLSDERLVPLLVYV
jgi:hypothetical protein